MFIRTLFALSCFICNLSACAFDTVRVAENIYALVGDLGQRSPQNLGHNMTSGFIVADTGGSHANAVAIHAAIRKVTDKKIVYAINSGGPAMLPTLFMNQGQLVPNWKLMTMPDTTLIAKLSANTLIHSLWVASQAGSRLRS